jgi:hypothetical protein
MLEIKNPPKFAHDPIVLKHDVKNEKVLCGAED